MVAHKYLLTNEYYSLYPSKLMIVYFQFLLIYSFLLNVFLKYREYSQVTSWWDK